MLYRKGFIRVILATQTHNRTYCPFVIHFFVPLIIHSFPSSLFTADVCIPITSLPAWASEIARQMNFLPARMSGMIYGKFQLADGVHYENRRW